METKYVRVAFDVELAKEITNERKNGRIVTRDGRYVRIVCFDALRTDNLVVLIPEGTIEKTYNYTSDGKVFINDESPLDLFLEIPEYMALKDGDVMSNDVGNYLFILSTNGNCKTSFYVSIKNGKIDDISREDELYGAAGDHIEFYHKANEEQIQEVIDVLKASKDPKAKEYLKRFFPNHSNSLNIGKNYEFNPKDWVLCKGNEWSLCRFSHTSLRGGNKLLYIAVGGIAYEYCIPYNEQTEHLLGTTENYE